MIFIRFFCNISLKICSVLKNQSLLQHKVVQLRQVRVLYLMLLDNVFSSWIIDFQDFSGFFDSDPLNFNHIYQTCSFDLIYLNIISLFPRVLICLIIFSLFVFLIVHIFWTFLVLAVIKLIIIFLFSLLINSFFYCFKYSFIFILIFIMVNLIFIRHLIILNFV